MKESFPGFLYRGYQRRFIWVNEAKKFSKRAL